MTTIFDLYEDTIYAEIVDRGSRIFSPTPDYYEVDSGGVVIPYGESYVYVSGGGLRYYKNLAYDNTLNDWVFWDTQDQPDPNGSQYPVVWKGNSTGTPSAWTANSYAYYFIYEAT